MSEPRQLLELLDLPNELLEQIFFILHPLEVIKCREVRMISSHPRTSID
jgi:hypothetical protein